MVAIVERSHFLQANLIQTSTECSLIQSIAQRTELLRSGQQTFTCEELRIIKYGERALQQLWETHRGLVLRLVSNYQTKGYNLRDLDLKQEAMLGFFNAVITFDPSKGSKLSTWAYFQVRGRLQKIMQQAIHADIAKVRIRQVAPVFSKTNPILDQGLCKELHSISNKLTKKQQQVISLYLEGWGWAEIALKLQSTTDAVRMLWNRTVKRLRLSFLGKEKREKQQCKVVKSQSLEQPKTVSELQPVEQPKNSSVSPRCLLQGLIQSLGCFYSLLKRVIKNFLLYKTMVVVYYPLDIPQWQGQQNLLGKSPIKTLKTYWVHNAQKPSLGCFNCISIWCLKFDCCDGIRGSP